MGQIGCRNCEFYLPIILSHRDPLSALHAWIQILYDEVYVRQLTGCLSTFKRVIYGPKRML